MEQVRVDNDKKARHSWYLYDFGNSAYAAIVLLAVYSAYFKNVVVGGAEGTRLWGISVGIAAILVAIMSPIFGTIADFTKSKKKILMVFTAMAIIFTALLFFVREGNVFFGMLFFILAEIGYRAAQVFYDALLSDVSTPASVNTVSGKGWAIGMFGSIIALLVVLLPIQLMGNSVIPFAFLITAAIYLLSSIPTFINVKEKQEPETLPPGTNVIVFALNKLLNTFKSVKKHKEFLKYAIAFLVYNDGIMMLMDFAAIIGATLFGLGQTELIIFVIVFHFSGSIGAFLFGSLADKKSSKDAIIFSLLILIASVACLFFISSLAAFYVVGFFAGFSLSAAQAVSRSMVSQLAPPTQSAEFFGFLSVAGRTSTFVGPLVFSTISYRMHNYYVNQGFTELVAEQRGLLWATGAIIAFLVVGMFLLFLVKRVHTHDVIAADVVTHQA